MMPGLEDNLQSTHESMDFLFHVVCVISYDSTHNMQCRMIPKKRELAANARVHVDGGDEKARV